MLPHVTDVTPVQYITLSRSQKGIISVLRGVGHKTWKVVGKATWVQSKMLKSKTPKKRRRRNKKENKMSQ